jgi:hypothetical protein
MFISRMAIPRRTFLRGLGTTIALPISTRWCRHSRRPRHCPGARVSFIYIANGVIRQ